MNDGRRLGNKRDDTAREPNVEQNERSTKGSEAETTWLLSLCRSRKNDGKKNGHASARRRRQSCAGETGGRGMGFQCAPEADKCGGSNLTGARIDRVPGGGKPRWTGESSRRHEA